MSEDKKKSSGCGTLIVILLGVGAFIIWKENEEQRRRQQQWQQQQQQQQWQQQPQVLPDLVIVGGDYAPASPAVKSGTTVRFRLIVRNIGTRLAGGFIRVTGPGNYSGGFPGGLGPGQERPAFVDIPLYGSNVTHTFRFRVDADNIISESNEVNNESGTFQIQTF